MALDVIIENNKELIMGVDRAVNVTVRALEVAVTVALALANPKIALTKIEALNKTTSDMIAGTAERLRTQGQRSRNRRRMRRWTSRRWEAAFRRYLRGDRRRVHLSPAGTPENGRADPGLRQAGGCRRGSDPAVGTGRAAAPTVEQQ